MTWHWGWDPVDLWMDMESGNMETGAWSGLSRQRKQHEQRSSLKLQKTQKKKKKILQEDQNDFSFYWVSPKIELKMPFCLSRNVNYLHSSILMPTLPTSYVLLIPWSQITPCLKAAGHKVLWESGHRSSNSVSPQNAKPTTLSWKKEEVKCSKGPSLTA